MIHSSGSGIWSSPPKIEQELRIGRVEGDDDYLFGDIAALAVGRDGMLYVADSHGPRIRAYDSAGRFLRQIGRPGGGPGEYRMITGMAITPSGELAIFDTSQRRITLFSADGELARTIDSTVGGRWRGNDFHVDGAGNFYVYGLLVNRNSSARPLPGLEMPVDAAGVMEPVFVKLSSSGEVIDTLAAPRSTRPRVPGFAVRTPEGVLRSFPDDLVFAFTPEGYFVQGYTDDRYVFEIGRAGGGPLRIEREYEPVPLGGEERDQWQARAAFYSRNRGSASAGTSIPEVKPAFRDIEVGTDGRIWVHRYAEAVERASRGARSADAPPALTWRDLPTFDVFEPDGTFLGTVVTPPDTRILLRDGEDLWGVQPGALDESYIVRLRLGLPE